MKDDGRCAHPAPLHRRNTFCRAGRGRGQGGRPAQPRQQSDGKAKQDQREKEGGGGGGRYVVVVVVVMGGRGRWDRTANDAGRAMRSEGSKEHNLTSRDCQCGWSPLCSPNVLAVTSPFPPHRRCSCRRWSWPALVDHMEGEEEEEAQTPKHPRRLTAYRIQSPRTFVTQFPFPLLHALTREGRLAATLSFFPCC